MNLRSLLIGERPSLHWRMLIFFMVFELFAAGRVFVEMRILADHTSMIVALHRFVWYTYVFLFFAMCYRRILHAPFERLNLLALGGIILFIPPLYAIIGGYEFQLNYLVSNDPVEIARELLTLHYGHEKNFLMFPELLTLFIGTIGISWYFSRSIPKTILNTLLAFYGAFLSAGLCWFSVDPKHDAVFRLTAMFRPQQFYAFQFLSLSLLLIILLLLPEILRTARASFSLRGAVAVVAGIVFWYALFIGGIAPAYGRPFTAVDIVAIAMPVLILSSVPLFLFSRTVPPAGKLFTAYCAALSLILLFAVHIMPLRF